jgi:lysozyme
MIDVGKFISTARQQGVPDNEIASYVANKFPQYQGQISAVSQNNGSSDWNGFIESAKKLAKQNDFPLSIILGQAALESNRGQAAPGNNYFGIKGQGDAGSNYLQTQEADPNGNYYTTQSPFRAYKSADSSIQDYIDLIKNQYGQAYAYRKDPAAMIQAIHSSGYATDPSYAQKVMSTPEFKQYYGS